MIDYGNAMPRTGIGIYGRLLLEAMQKYCTADIVAGEAGMIFAANNFRPVRRLLYLAGLEVQRSTHFSKAQIVHFINQYVPRPDRYARFVVTIHDLDPIMMPEAHTRQFVFYFDRIVKRAIDRAEMIVVQSATVREELLARFSLLPVRIQIAGQGLSPEFMQLVDGEPKTVPTMPTLLYVGQLSMKKNIAWLVKTFHAGVVSGALPRAKLIVAGGKGHGFSEIYSALRDAATCVEWCESPTLRDLVRLYSSCSALVLPSLREGFGRPLLEAMYCDKPIVSSRIPSSVALAGNGAHFFSLGDRDEFYHAVGDAIEDKLYEVRRKTAASQLERFSWQNLSKVYLNIYNQTLQQ